MSGMKELHVMILADRDEDYEEDGREDSGEHESSQSKREAEAYVEGWLKAASVALENACYAFNDQREAAELLFSGTAEEDYDNFIDALLGYSGLDFDLDKRVVAPDDDALAEENDEEECCDYHDSFAKTKDTSRIDLGKRGEDAAVRCLEHKGYEILERNWECDFGEADIIALSPEGSVVFIEVKTRKSLRAGFPEEAITLQKRKRYEKIAVDYMTKSDWEDGTPIRFDAVGIIVRGNDRAVLRHHIGFFDACD